MQLETVSPPRCKPYYLRKRGTKLLERVYWRRWNLDYTKRIMAAGPGSAKALELLSVWSARIQRALIARFGTGASDSAVHGSK